MGQQDYRAVEVIPGKNCSCDLSKLAGKRILISKLEYLISRASFFPLCTCKFKHFADRRQGIERRNFDLENLDTVGQIRTQPYGRRAADIHNRSRARTMSNRLSYNFG